MLKPVAHRPDWYTVDREALLPISGVPGLTQLKNGHWIAHRSHLPLLANHGNVEASNALWPVPTDFRWPERSKRLAELGITLRNTQHSGIDFIEGRRGTLLGDEMRLGKTLTCAASHDMSLGSFVVICPAMVRPVWIGWLQKVFPGEPIGVMKGRTFDPEIADRRIIVGHYEILSSWQSSRPIGTLVFDEAHVLSNPNSWRSKAAVYLASKAQRVICATGTPIWNLPMNLWNILTLIAPAAFGGMHEFGVRYGAPIPTAHGTRYTGISNEGELSERLAEVMIRRKWVDVAEELPEISRNVVQVDLTEDQRYALDISSAAILAERDKGSTIGLLSAYRKTCAKIKRRVAVEQATAMIERGEPVVVWTWHVDLAEQIAKGIGDDSFLITGDTPMAKRDEILAKWRAHPHAALVCNMAVGQVGLDFSHSHLAIFAEIDYTPAILSQAEMRTYAPTRGMNITYIIVDHLVDRRIVMALTKKLAAANPLGVAAADETISILGITFGGEPEDADMDRLLEGILSS